MVVSTVVKHVAVGLAGGLAIAMAGGAAWAVTPISGGIHVGASVSAGGLSDSDTGADAWALTPDSLSASADAQVSPEQGRSVSGSVRAAANFGANSGSANFYHGWSFVDAPGPASAALHDNQAAWTYTFEALGDGQFDLTYDIFGSGDTSSLWGWAIEWSGAGGGLSLYDSDDPTAAGTFSRSITAGELYTVALTPYPNRSSNCSNCLVGGIDGQMLSSFSYKIAEDPGAVPEPGTWAMTIVGFGLAGAMLRRRRAVAAV
jgi:hypothetical protein